MTKFVEKVIKEDAWYFFRQGFISESQYRRVLRWQEGAHDLEIQRMIAGWLESDIEYITEVEDHAADQVRYMRPLVKVATRVFKSQLRKAVEELR